jgi:predicted enzyme related to lactoylglutathione lyase
LEADKTIGAITWMDLTVEHADAVRDFYKEVVGWKSMDVSMGSYNDFCMISPEDDQVRTGICHAQGVNTGIPSQWIMYINVADLDKSLDIVKQNGGRLINGPRKIGESRFCIIQDPAGAYVGLFQHGT